MVAISSKDEDYPLFWIKAHKIKQSVDKQIQKLKKSILDKVSEWCIEEVQAIKKAYAEMGERIKRPPNDEEELVAIRAFIDDAPWMNQELQGRVRNVGNHIVLMDDYCYKFSEDESLEYWSTKTLPQEIISDIAIGKRDIEDKSEIFMTKLE